MGGEATKTDRSWPARWVTLALAPILLGLALWALPRAIQAGDAGEFATVMLTGGVPHPSGYPWMRILGLLARPLAALGLNPASAAALPPTLAGVVGWLIVHRSCVQLGRPLAGAFVVVLLAGSPLMLLHGCDSEVWGPHLLFSAIVVHVVVRTRDRPRPLLLGLALGLAVSHHLTAVLLVPLAVGGAWPRSAGPKLAAPEPAAPEPAAPEPAAPEPAAKPGGRGWLGELLGNAGLGLLGSAIGLLPLLSLAIGRGGGWRWGDTSTAAGLARHVLRVDYGTFRLSLHDEPVSAMDTVARSLASLGEQLSAGLIDSAPAGAALVLALVAGAGWASRRPAGAAAPLRPAVALGWLASVAATVIAFPARQNIDPASPFGAWILERFDLLPCLLLAPLAALGLGALRDELRRASTRERAAKLIDLGAGSIALALHPAPLAAVLERGRPASERAVELAALDLVETPDPDAPGLAAATAEPVRAIVFGTDDHRSFPVLYVQEVLGAGAHTLYIDAQLLAHPWYRARLRRRLPTLPDVDKPLRLIGAIWDDRALAGVPIYVANEWARPVATLAKVPEGPLWRVPLPPRHPDYRAEDWTAGAILDRHLAASARSRVRARDFGALEHPRGHPWSSDLWHGYVGKARALAQALRAQGQQVPAELQILLARQTGAQL